MIGPHSGVARARRRRRLYVLPSDFVSISRHYLAIIARDYPRRSSLGQLWTFAKPPARRRGLLLSSPLLLSLLLYRRSGEGASYVKLSRLYSYSFPPPLPPTIVGDNIITYTYKKITSYPSSAPKFMHEPREHTPGCAVARSRRWWCEIIKLIRV